MGKREKNPNLAPEAYATNLVAFAAAMKAVDPSIRIGTALMVLDGQPVARDWNSKVLKSACASRDFVSLYWQPLELDPKDWKTLNEAAMLHDSRGKIGEILNGMLDLYRQNCPNGRQPNFAFAPAAIPAGRYT